MTCSSGWWPPSSGRPADSPNDQSPSSGLRTDVPHPARVYNYWLGGKDHFSADRAAAEDVKQARPEVVATAQANRYFLARVVRYLVTQCGIRQFLDIGTGLPAPDNTHEIAQREAPDCRIVYADNDPLVLAHARALLTSTPRGTCAYVDADLRDIPRILSQAKRTLDPSQPVAVLLLAVLHLIADADGPASLIAALTAGLAPGSCLAITHLTADFAPGPVTAAVRAYNAAAPVPVTARTRAQIAALFGALPLLGPGIVPVTSWRPDVSDPEPSPADLYAGVARIPAERR